MLASTYAIGQANIVIKPDIAKVIKITSNISLGVAGSRITGVQSSNKFIRTISKFPFIFLIIKSKWIYDCYNEKSVPKN